MKIPGLSNAEERLDKLEADMEAINESLVTTNGLLVEIRDVLIQTAINAKRRSP